KPARYRRAISYDSKEYYMRLASGNPAVFQDAIEESSEGEATQQEPEHGEDTIAKIQHMYRCARVQGLDTSEGLLLFGKEHFYVIDGFTMTATREIRDIETLPPNMHEPIIPRGARQGPSQLKRTCSIFAYEDIKEVHKRRYLLQVDMQDHVCLIGDT
ncbi:hypothetical protein Chor_001180, partial [Crotalus horridus]